MCVVVRSIFVVCTELESTRHYRMLAIFIGQPDLGTHIYEALMFKARSNIIRVQWESYIIRSLKCLMKDRDSDIPR